MLYRISFLSKCMFTDICLLELFNLKLILFLIAQASAFTFNYNLYFQILRCIRYPDSQICREQILQSVRYKFCWQEGYKFDRIWSICNAGRIPAEM